MPAPTRTISCTWREVAHVGVIALGLLLCGAAPAAAKTIKTTTTRDGLGAGTLRAAIIEANQTPGADVIVLCADGVYEISRKLHNDDAANGGDFDVTESVEVRSPIDGDFCERGGNRSIDAKLDFGRVFDVIDGTLTVRGLTLLNGRTIEADTQSCDVAGGGAICVRAATGGASPTLIIVDSTIKGSRATHGGGIWVGQGAVATLDRVTIEGCVVRALGGSQRAGYGGGLDVDGGTVHVRNRSAFKSNVASDGGAIAIADGTLTLTNSVVSGNGVLPSTTDSGTIGGGLLVGGNAKVYVENTTISGNLGLTGGGIRYVSSEGETGELTLDFVTLANNKGGQSGGIAALVGGALAPKISNTIVSGNKLGDDKASDCSGAIRSGRFNLVQNPGIPDTPTACGATCDGTSGWCASDLVPRESEEDDDEAQPLDPKLAALSDDGFHALPVDSPAVNAVDAGVECPSTDQRGTGRTPADGPQCRCDIGAFELALPDRDGDGVIDCDDSCREMPSRPLEQTPRGTTPCDPSRTDQCAADQVCRTHQCVLERCTDQVCKGSTFKACDAAAPACPAGEACRGVVPSICVSAPCDEHADCTGTGFCQRSIGECRFPPLPRDPEGDSDGDGVKDCEEPDPCLGSELGGDDDQLKVASNGCTLSQACDCDQRLETCLCGASQPALSAGAVGEPWSSRKDWKTCFKFTAQAFNAGNDSVCPGLCRNYKVECTDCGADCEGEEGCEPCDEKCAGCADVCKEKCPGKRCPTVLAGRKLTRFTRRLIRQVPKTCGRREPCKKTLAEVLADPQGDCDGDLIANGSAKEPIDNCPTKFNKRQQDTDDDGKGDACDPDDDADGKPDAEDNCSRVPNPGQEDADDDNVGNDCDQCKGTSRGDDADGRGCGPGQKPDPDAE